MLADYGQQSRDWGTAGTPGCTAGKKKRYFHVKAFKDLLLMSN